jgi:tetratricopeptide (TPR) repeat protein
MYDESILELEEIEGEDRWHPTVVEARYKTYRDAKEWVLAEGMPDKLEWLKNQADAMTECGDTAGALQLLKEASERFGVDGKFLLAIGRQYALLCEIEEAKKYVKRAIKADSSLKGEFFDDPAFDPVWESF